MRARLVVAFVALSMAVALPAYAKSGPSAVPITKDSEEGKNVQLAIDFLKKMGEDAKAQNLIEMFQAGKIYWDPKQGTNGDTTDGEITVSESIIHQTNKADRGKAFNPYLDYENIVALARTLYHEKIHVHQSSCFIVGSNLRDKGGYGAPHEQEAWEDTILAMDRWIKKTRDKWKKNKANLKTLYELVHLLRVKSNYLADFTSSESNCQGEPAKNCQAWKDLFDTIDQAFKYYDGVLNPVKDQVPQEEEPEDSSKSEKISFAPPTDDELAQHIGATETREAQIDGQLAADFNSGKFGGLARSVCLAPHGGENASFEPSSGIAIGLGVGFGLPFGGVDGGTKPLSLNDLYGSMIPFELDAAYRFAFGLDLGIHGAFGPAFIAESACPSALSCGGSVRRVGVEAKYHIFLPKSPVEPWGGIGIGYEWAHVGESASGVDSSSTYHGLEFADLRVGADYHIDPHFAVGPFVSFSMGEYSAATFTTQGRGGSNDITAKSLHEWLVFGIRGEYFTAL